MTMWEPTTVVLTPAVAEDDAESEAAAASMSASSSSAAAEALAAEAAPILDPATVSRRVKRKKLSAIGQLAPA